MSSSSMWGGFRPSTAFRLSRWKFMIFAWFFFFETQNFQKFYIKPPKFLILTCFKQQKRKLHCILTLITDLGLKWQAIKWAWGGIRPSTAWLGLKLSLSAKNIFLVKKIHNINIVFFLLLDLHSKIATIAKRVVFW